MFKNILWLHLTYMYIIKIYTLFSEISGARRAQLTTGSAPFMHSFYKIKLCQVIRTINPFKNIYIKEFTLYHQQIDKLPVGPT